MLIFINFPYELNGFIPIGEIYWSHHHLFLYRKSCWFI